MTQYAKNSGAVFSLKYHLVWCPKYRRPVLEGAIEKRLREVLEDVRAEHVWTIHALEVMPDHVHLFIRTPEKPRPSGRGGRGRLRSSRAL